MRLTTEQAAARAEAIRAGIAYGMTYFDACQMADFYVGMQKLPKHMQIYVLAILRWSAIQAQMRDVWRRLLKMIF